MRFFESKRQSPPAHGYRLLERAAKGVDQHASIGRRQGQIASQTVQRHRTVGHHRHTGSAQRIALKKHRQIDIADRDAVTSGAHGNRRVTGRDNEPFAHIGFLPLDAEIALDARETINRHRAVCRDRQIGAVRRECDRAAGINRHPFNARDRQRTQNRARGPTVAVNPQLTITLRQSEGHARRRRDKGQIVKIDDPAVVRAIVG